MTDQLTIGELCAGYNGLGMAVEAAFGARTAWFSEYDAEPSRILAHHWPDVPNHGDMTKIDWAAVERVDIISGGTPCFPVGTLIDTEDGYRPIETIRIGDLVRTHRQRYMPVVQLMRRQSSDTIAVKVMGSPLFVTTREHPFYVRTKSRVWNNDRRQYDRVWSEPDWVPAGLLDTASFVGFQIDQRDETVPALGEPLAYIVGRWLGDGWVRNSKRTHRVTSLWWQAHICCAPAEADVLVKKFAAADLHAMRADQRTTVRFTVNSEALVKLLMEFGKGAHGKRIPGWVYRLPVADQRALWQGWAESDGSTQASGQIRVTTVSPELAHGMARIARNTFRRAASVHHSPMPATCVIEGRTVNQRDQYQVVLPTSNREAFVEGDWVWVPVRTVIDAPAAEVFNFGVAEDESYTAWGLTVHNCQDLSHAGRRKGMSEGTRSNLWVQMREAIATIRPKYVIWENVRGAFSAAADSDVEPCPGCVGDGTGVSLRALGRVLGDLADLGYDAAWHGLTAASVGAPHGRFRVFVLAWDTRGGAAGDTAGVNGQRGGAATGRTSGGAGPDRGPGRAAAQDTDVAASGERRVAAPGQEAGGRARPDSGGRGRVPAAADAVGARCEGDRPVGGESELTWAGGGDGAAADAISGGLDRRARQPVGGQVERATAARGGEDVTADPSSVGWGEGRPEPAGQLWGSDAALGGASPDIAWGAYEPAVRRWGAVLGRPAPAPTATGKKGAERLSESFVEWMMGLPAGHVCDVPGLSRNGKLKALGNGVVPQQAFAAIQHLLAATEGVHNP